MSPAPISTSTDVLIKSTAKSSSPSKSNGADFANVLASVTKPVAADRNDKPVDRVNRDDKASDNNKSVDKADRDDTAAKDKADVKDAKDKANVDKAADKKADDKSDENDVKAGDKPVVKKDDKGEAVKDVATEEVVTAAVAAPGVTTPTAVPATVVTDPTATPVATDANAAATIAPELAAALATQAATAPQPAAVAPTVATIQITPTDNAAIAQTVVDPTATDAVPVATDAAAQGQTPQVATDETNPLLATLAANTPLVAEAKAATAPVVPEAKQVSNDAAMAKAAIDSLAAASRTSETQQQTITPTSTKLTDTTMRSEPYQQVVKMVAPLRHLADGDYSVTMKLHPAHLGSVEITVALAGGQVNMSMNTDSSAARQILRDSMNDLRQSLTDSGLNAGSLDVGSQNAGRGNGQNDQQNTNNSTWGTGADENDTFVRFNAAVPANVTAVNDGPLDVRL